VVQIISQSPTRELGKAYQQLVELRFVDLPLPDRVMAGDSRQHAKPYRRKAKKSKLKESSAAFKEF